MLRQAISRSVHHAKPSWSGFSASSLQAARQNSEALVAHARYKISHSGTPTKLAKDWAPSSWMKATAGGLGTRFMSSAPKSPSPSVVWSIPKATEVLPGLIFAGAVMEASFFVADHIGGAIMAAQGLPEAASPLSGIPVAIMLGALVNNTASLPAAVRPGLKFATAKVLRAGIVCVGAKLSLLEVVTVGWKGLPCVAASMGVGLTFVPWFNRLLGLPPRLGALIAAGTSICGVTAITCLAPAIRATQQEVAFAVANVVAFGLISMLTYPALCHRLLDNSNEIGLVLGTAVHDTAQVLGSALSYKEMYGDEEVLTVATVTKLTRNLLLAGAIPYLTWSTLKAMPDAGSGAAKMPLSTLFPLFVVGFVAAAAVRSLGDYSLAQGGPALGLMDAQQWKEVKAMVGDQLGSHYFLGTAMAAVGLSTDVSVVKGVGIKPFVVGFAGATVVGATGLATAIMTTKYIG